MAFKIYLLVIMLFAIGYVYSHHSENDGQLRIAVIGGGIGGTSVSYFLKKSLPDSSVTLYEPGDIGGRLRTVDMAGMNYECGGSIIHPKNQLMVDLVQEMNLSPRPPDHWNSRFTIIDENGVLFQQSPWSYLQPLQLIYRYGIFSLLKLHYFIQGMLEDFASIYPFLNDGNSVDTVEDMLKVMSPNSRKNKSLNNYGLLDLVTISLEEELLRQSQPQNLIDELVTVAVRVNYGQMPDSVHAFVGSVALAGAEGELWAIEGGNHVLAEKLFTSSGANLMQENVHKITRNSNGTWNVATSNEKFLNYDMVILATPMTTDTQNMSIEGLDEEVNFPGKYHQTVATLVDGDLNPEYFGLTDDTMTETIFFVDSKFPINSVSLLTPTKFDEEIQELPNVWKVFSQQPLTVKDLSDIFSERREVKVCDWLAYPNYSTNQTLSDFVITNNLYHINSIEWSASAMEMSVIGAKNVANIIIAKHHGKKINSNDENENLMHSHGDL